MALDPVALEAMARTLRWARQNCSSEPRAPTCLSEGSARPQALLRDLRQQSQFCDAVIAVGDTQFPVHRAIVAQLSSFFLKSFSGDFSEAASRKLTVGDASPEAVSVVLDFAYGVNVSAALQNESNLACDVWKLAHRFEVSELVQTAGSIAVEGATVQNSVRLFLQAKLFECQEEEEKMFLFIVRRLKEVSQDCLDFRYQISVNELEEFLSSEELIAEEVDVYNCVKTWCEAVDDESREECLEYLLSYVNFELMQRTDLREVLRDADFVPKQVLCHALERNLYSGVCIPGVHLDDIYTAEKYKTHKRARSGADVAIPLGKRTDVFFPKHIPSFVFKCNRWVMSAHTEMRKGDLFLDLRFERRLFATDYSHSLREDLSGFTFEIVSKIVADSSDPFDTLHYSRLWPENNMLSVKVLRKSAAIVPHGMSDDSGSLTLLANVMYRSSHSAIDTPLQRRN